MDASDDPALEFRAVFGTETKNPYSKSRVDEIQQYRALLDNELFFDHLLVSFAQISDGKPPLASPPSSLTPLSNRLLPTAFSQRPQISAQRNHHLHVLGLP
jgi:hypothetical protein